MELILWVFPRADGGHACRLVPSACEELLIEDGEPSGHFTRGAGLRSPTLPFALALARAEGAAAAGFEPERLQLRLSLTPDPPSGAPLMPEEDELGFASLTAEYATALAEIVEALRLPLRWLAPAQGALELELGPLAEEPASPTRERVRLLFAAADLLARARGFRVPACDVRYPGAAWRPLAEGAVGNLS